MWRPECTIQPTSAVGLVRKTGTAMGHTERAPARSSSTRWHENNYAFAGGAGIFSVTFDGLAHHGQHGWGDGPVRQGKQRTPPE